MRLIFLLTFFLAIPSALHAEQSQPNIILLLADDLGYADLTCFGGTNPTPHLDSLAKQGTKLTQFYAASAVCTPTRASIITGKYPLRFNIRQHFTDGPEHLPRGTVTLPKLLKQAGYVTAHVGKWHLGGLHVDENGNRKQDIPGPKEQGFDYYQCQIEQQPIRGKLGRERTLFRKGGTCLMRDGVVIKQDDPYYSKHFTDINGDYTVELIEKFSKQNKPFFLNLWWLVPHMPYEPAPEPHWSATAAQGISDNQHRFRSMVRHMDAKIGKILAKLKELGLDKNTLVLFTSDNGGAYEANIADFKGGKTDLHEGGIRVPMIARWPGHIPANTTSEIIGSTIDLLPTFCHVAGVDPLQSESIDGINLMHALRGSKELPQRTLFWQMDIYRHLQRHAPKPKPYATEITFDGKWKLLSLDGTPVELFNISTDHREQTNLLTTHPDRAKQMASQVKSWLNEPRHGWQDEN